jgi:hypothetical protein
MSKFQMASTECDGEGGEGFKLWIDGTRNKEIMS